MIPEGAPVLHKATPGMIVTPRSDLKESMESTLCPLLVVSRSVPLMAVFSGHPRAQWPTDLTTSCTLGPQFPLRNLRPVHLGSEPQTKEFCRPFPVPVFSVKKPHAFCTSSNSLLTSPYFDSSGLQQNLRDVAFLELVPDFFHLHIADSYYDFRSESVNCRCSILTVFVLCLICQKRLFHLRNSCSSIKPTRIRLGVCSACWIVEEHGEWLC